MTETRRTYIITGNGRGGTSMVAGVAHLLGLDMNFDLGVALNCEDNDLVFLYLRNQGLSPEAAVKHIRETIVARNDVNDVWGWKDPEARHYLSDVVTLLRNPALILVMRDPAAVATGAMSVPADREHYHEGSLKDRQQRVSAHLQLVLYGYERTIALTRELQIPTLVVSYERSRDHADDLARDLAKFLGLPLTNEKLSQIEAFVSPTGGYAVRK